MEPRKNARHICLVTPAHLSRNPRLVKEADALLEAGYKVTIVHGKYCSWAMKTDEEFDDRAWQVITFSYGPIAGLVKRVWNKLVHLSARFLVAMRIDPDCLMSELAVHPAAFDLWRKTKEVKADLYIAHNLAALGASGRAAQLHRAEFSFDAEDDHVGELQDIPQHRAERDLRHKVQKKWLHKCAYRTTASPLMAQSLNRQYGLQFTSILNVFPKEKLSQSSNSGMQKTLYWFSQTIGPNRGLEQIITIMGQMSIQVDLHIRGQVDSEYAELIKALAQSCGVDEMRIKYQPVSKPSDMVPMASGYALGLSIECENSTNRKVCLSNKIFQYLMAGTPVLLSDTPAQRALAVELGDASLLIDIENSASSAMALSNWLTNSSAQENARSIAWSLARTKFCWDVEKLKFNKLVCHAISNCAVNS